MREITLQTSALPIKSKWQPDEDQVMLGDYSIIGLQADFMGKAPQA
jgi:hypothetical protein